MQGEDFLPSTAIVLVDIIGSKKIASQPGGYGEITNLSRGMRNFLRAELERLTSDKTVTITEQDSQGDDVKYRLNGENLGNIADASIGAVIKAFSSFPDGERFRYVVYRVESEIDYQPRIKAFGEISKTDEGRKYHIAIEGGVAMALTNTGSIEWLRNAAGKRIVLQFEGESFTGTYVNLCCPITTEFGAHSQSPSEANDHADNRHKGSLDIKDGDDCNEATELSDAGDSAAHGNTPSSNPSRSDIAIALWRRLRSRRRGF